MKIKNFNSGWGQMVVAHARRRQLVRLGVADVQTMIRNHNDRQSEVMAVYASRGYRVLSA